MAERKSFGILVGEDGRVALGPDKKPIEIPKNPKDVIRVQTNTGEQLSASLSELEKQGFTVQRGYNQDYCLQENGSISDQGINHIVNRLR